jgi:hypothetical protein
MHVYKLYKIHIKEIISIQNKLLNVQILSLLPVTLNNSRAQAKIEDDSFMILNITIIKITAAIY